MSKEKKTTRVRNESTSSTNSIDIKPSRGRKPKNTDLFDSENTTTQDTLNSSSSSIGSLRDHSDSELSSFRGGNLYNGQSKNKTSNKSFTVNGILDSEKDIKSSPLNTPVHNGVSSCNNNKDNISTKKRLKSTVAEDADNETDLEGTIKETNNKKRKLTDKDNHKSRLKVDKDKTGTDRPIKDKKKKEKTNIEKKKKEKGLSEKKKKYPQPSQLGLVENGKVSSYNTANEKL